MDDSTDLHRRYRCLRQQLDAAYAAAEWDSSRIDRITEEMAPIERALASCSAHAGADDGDRGDRCNRPDGDDAHACA